MGFRAPLPPDPRPLTAGLAGALTLLAVSYQQLVASVLDLAARGQVKVELVTVDDDAAARVWWYLENTARGKLWTYETVLLTELRVLAGPSEFPSLNNRSAEVVSRALWDDLVHAGWITGSPVRARVAQLRISAAVAVVGVVSLLSSLQLFLGWGIGLGLLIGSVALARSSSRQAIPTGLGQEAQFTAQSDRTRILKKPHTPDSDLALAVALGIGNEYMTAAAQTGAPVPSWLYSRSYTITWDHVRALVEQPGRGWPFSASSITGIGH